MVKTDKQYTAKFFNVENWSIATYTFFVARAIVK